MEHSIILPDNEGNHLLVVLDFYDDKYKHATLNLPEEFIETEIVDISIRKHFLDRPIGVIAFFNMGHWLVEEMRNHPDAIFTFIVSLDPLDHNHSDLSPEDYRWRLFDVLYQRFRREYCLDCCIQNIEIGPEGYKTYARAFYGHRHSPIIHIIASHLTEKYATL